MKKSYEMDMIHGPLVKNVLIYAFPLMLSGILQLLFNAADVIVVGRFAGPQALAAVGSTGSLTGLLTNLFIGLSIGTNVLVARYYGAQNYDSIKETIDTSIITAFSGGLILVVVGLFASRPLLAMMDTPADVIDLSVLYMQILFAGMPFQMLYNFGAAILRSVGDTRRPLYFLSIAGVVNVILNLIFVIVFKMSVAGVALATIASHCVSCVLVLRCLIQSDSIISLDIKNLKFSINKMAAMLKIGLPAGFQGIVFSISNMLIQSSVNSFGSTVMAGNTAAQNIESFVYTGMNAFYQTNLSFTSQNYGAKNPKRIDRVLVVCLVLVTIVGLILGNGAYLLGNTLLGLYSTDAEVIGYGLNRLSVIAASYCICGMMDVFVGTIRGLGFAIMPMIVSLLGACVLRVVWVLTIFQMYHTQFSLYISYPISWLVTASVHLCCYLVVRKKIFAKLEDKIS
ncbi:MAG: MATE family efflux transporter [Clostridia bacterium]|nr:MATE family efflux transporter [Clostridia bacterium]MBR5265793.1 MATE family efflux transporter [Clostridia bacterium]